MEDSGIGTMEKDMWQCDWPGCGELVKKKGKGFHIGRHRKNEIKKEFPTGKKREEAKTTTGIDLEHRKYKKEFSVRTPVYINRVGFYGTYYVGQMVNSSYGNIKIDEALMQELLSRAAKAKEAIEKAKQSEGMRMDFDEQGNLHTVRTYR